MLGAAALGMQLAAAAAESGGPGYASYQELVMDNNCRNAVLALPLRDASLKLVSDERWHNTNAPPGGYYNEVKMLAFEWWRSPGSFRRAMLAVPALCWRCQSRIIQDQYMLQYPCVVQECGVQLDRVARTHAFPMFQGGRRTIMYLCLQSPVLLPCAMQALSATCNRGPESSCVSP